MGTATVEDAPLAEAPTPVTSPSLDAALDRVAALLDRAERPVLAIGRGVLLAGAMDAVTRPGRAHRRAGRLDAARHRRACRSRTR